MVRSDHRYGLGGGTAARQVGSQRQSRAGGIGEAFSPMLIARRLLVHRKKYPFENEDRGKRLICAQRLQRIDLCGPPSRQPAGDEGEGEQQHGAGDEGHWIVGRDPVELILDHVGQG